MAQHSHHKQTGLTVTYFDPLVRGSSGALYSAWLETSGYGDRLTDQFSDYRHEIKAFGGYWSSRFTISDQLDRLEDWFDAGLGRHVEVHDDALVKVWEGFASKVSLNVGPLSITRGPLLDIGNKVRVGYSTIDTSVDPPTMGVRIVTGYTDDYTSQGWYGVIEKMLSAGGMTTADAEQVRDTYLAENKEPQTSARLSSGGSKPSVTVECLGYVHWLSAFTYNNSGNGTVDLDSRLMDVLDEEPNEFFSSYNADLDANTLQVPAYESKNPKGLAVIKGLVSLGDSSDNRYDFGIYGNRRAAYTVAPTDTRYQFRLAEPTQHFETPTGGQVKPWNLLPARWLFIPDLLVGRSQPDDKRLDPRYMYVESVSFTAPWGVQLNGGRVDTIAQKLARLGLAGIGT